MWIDIASIVFICVTAIHLGLVEAVMNTKAARRIYLDRCKILTCPKCLTFWCCVIYGAVRDLSPTGLTHAIAVSFLASYCALWVELFEGFIDYIYNKVYETLYPTTDNDNSLAATDNAPCTDSEMSELRGYGSTEAVTLS